MARQPLEHLPERVHVGLREALGLEVQPTQGPAALRHLLRREGEEDLPNTGQISLHTQQQK